MPDNRISASLSQADRQAVLDALNTIRTKLPFLMESRIIQGEAAEIAPGIRDILSELVDHFISDYKSVNGNQLCATAPPNNGMHPTPRRRVFHAR